MDIFKKYDDFLKQQQSKIELRSIFAGFFEALVVTLGVHFLFIPLTGSQIGALMMISSIIFSKMYVLNHSPNWMTDQMRKQIQGYLLAKGVGGVDAKEEVK